MAIIDNVNETLHRIRVKLYPNYLPHSQGKYIARTDDEASLSIEQVCAAAKNRGGFTGSYEALAEYTKAFFDEAAYQLADGYSVNMGWFSMHPKVGGTFDKAGPADPKTNKINFSFRVRSPLRNLASKIEILVEGIADVQGYIDEVTDVHSGSVNEILTPGGVITISGHKLKIEGDKPEVGLYFVEQSSGNRVKVSEHLAENNAVKVIALIPALPAGTYHLELVSQFTNGSVLLKEPRIIGYGADLTVS